jgi:Domain of unknown function (DUF6089)
MKKHLLFLITTCITSISVAQVHEIGFFAGGSNYVGDIGPTYYIAPNKPAFGVVYKWNKNPRMAFRGTYTYIPIEADDTKASSEGRKLRGSNFKNTINEVALGLEFNFFEYDLSSHKNKSTPYLLFEVAGFNYKVVDHQTGPNEYSFKSKTSYAIPFGIGYKSLLSGSLAFAVEARVRYTFVDDLDYNKKDIPALDFGNPDSNDWYMFTGFSVVYTFGRPACYTTPYK